MPSLLSLSFFCHAVDRIFITTKGFFCIRFSLRRSCPPGSNTGLRIESGLMDLTEIWGKFHWLRVGISSNQVGQVSKGSYHRKKELRASGEKPWASVPGPRWPGLGYWASGFAFLWVRYLLYKIGREKFLKRKLKFIKRLLYLESLQHAS